jgi:hypothetical protein
MSRSRFVALALLALMASSCGAARDASRVGMERDQTNITYGFTPVSSTSTKGPLGPLGPQAALGPTGPVQTPLPTFSSIFNTGGHVAAGPCPTADPTAPVASRASTEVAGRPQPGSYVWRVSGSYAVANSKVPLPNVMVQYVLPSKSFTDTFPGQAQPQSDDFTYQTLQPGFGDQAGTTNSAFLYSWQVKTDPKSAGDPAGGLVLKKLEYTDSAGHHQATYYDSGSTAGLLMAPFPVKAGQSWNSVAFDVSQGHALQLSAQVLRRDVLDVCGTPIEAWHVHGTLNDEGNNSTLDYLIATQYGGRIVQFAADGQIWGANFTKANFHVGTLKAGPLPRGLS